MASICLKGGTFVQENTAVNPARQVYMFDVAVVTLKPEIGH